MVAILFAAFSMAATVVAIFRYKADLDRPISHIVGIEGMMVITVLVVIFFFFFFFFFESLD
jgi:amino acid transporter